MENQQEVTSLSQLKPDAARRITRICLRALERKRVAELGTKEKESRSDDRKG